MSRSVNPLVYHLPSLRAYIDYTFAMTGIFKPSLANYICGNSDSEEESPQQTLLENQGLITIDTARSECRLTAAGIGALDEFLFPAFEGAKINWRESEFSSCDPESMLTIALGIFVEAVYPRDGVYSVDDSEWIARIPSIKGAIKNAGPSRVFCERMITSALLLGRLSAGAELLYMYQRKLYSAAFRKVVGAGNEVKDGYEHLPDEEFNLLKYSYIVPVLYALGAVRVARPA